MAIAFQGWGFGTVNSTPSYFAASVAPSNWSSSDPNQTEDDGTDGAGTGQPGSISPFAPLAGQGLQGVDPVSQPAGVPTPFVEGASAPCADGSRFEAVAADAPHNAVRLQWELRPHGLDPAQFTFEIQRAESPGFRNSDDFTVVTTGRVGITEYEDCDVNLENLFRVVYYRVVATMINQEEIQFVSPVMRTNLRPADHRDIILREIRHRMQTLMRYTGTPVAYYPVKTFGQRCHVCYSEILSRASDSKCKACYRTTFLGGYHLPLPRYVQFSPSPKRPDLRLEGKEHRTFAAAIMEHDPIAQPGDLIKDLETGEFWDVASVEPPTTKLGAIGHQNLVLYKLDRDDIEWQVAGKVNFDSFCTFERWDWHPTV